MKNRVLSIMLCLFWLSTTAQVPQAFNYQTVIRDLSGKVLSNKNVTFRICILQGSATGPAVYCELHGKTTDDFGLVDLEIGNGSSPSGSFIHIEWNSGTYFIKTEVDPAGGIAFQEMGTCQLLSVPYALFAKISGNSNGGDYDNLINKPVILNNALQTTATGYQALQSNTGTSNTAGGYQALLSNTTGNDNTATGIFALKENSTGWGNTASGSMSLMVNSTGYRNTANGVVALPANTTGSDNSATGAYSLYNNSIGWGNTAGGARALYSNGEGNFNTANGVEALYSNTTGVRNTATGVNSIRFNTTGSDNTANGYEANYGNTGGTGNTSAGSSALYSNTTGNNNTAIGNQAGYLNETGSGNVFIGSSAGYYETTSDNLFIDNQKRYNIVDAREKALIYGKFNPDPDNQVLRINAKIDAGDRNVINLANPLNPHEAATKIYVDIQIEALINSIAAGGKITDVDGNHYNTVVIGTQTWMAENLKSTKYNDGSIIPNVTANAEWAAWTTGAWCWYNNDAGNKNIYGALYNWYAVNTGILCPTGWHVPNDADWTTLKDYLINNGYGFQGSGDDIAKSLAAKTNWESSPTSGAPGNDQISNNSSGFSGLPAGIRVGDGQFRDISSVTHWWSSTDNSFPWNYGLQSNSLNMVVTTYVKYLGLSVRCMRN